MGRSQPALDGGPDTSATAPLRSSVATSRTLPVSPMNPLHSVSCPKLSSSKSATLHVCVHAMQHAPLRCTC
eukprot:11524171-Prorocentrum_lima.AAC.1